MTDQEQKEWDLKLRKMDSEISKLNAETAKLTGETRYYVILITSTATLAIVAFVKLFM